VAYATRPKSKLQKKQSIQIPYSQLKERKSSRKTTAQTKRNEDVDVSRRVTPAQHTKHKRETTLHFAGECREWDRFTKDTNYLYCTGRPDLRWTGNLGWTKKKKEMRRFEETLYTNYLRSRLKQLSTLWSTCNCLQSYTLSSLSTIIITPSVIAHG
jgi:hypothetical protein